jgi:bifunctional DNA-binding transcriptional regulator/antitoxin component of YhaV-PrlF toxin-antitoxin module
VQLTLPRHVREALGTDTVEIEIIGGKVVLRPVRSVAGVLAKYASGEIPLAEIRDKVWQERGQRIENTWIPANSIIASGNNEQ